MPRLKFEDCIECSNYREGNDHICEVCESGDMFEEIVVELNFHEGERDE